MQTAGKDNYHSVKEEGKLSLSKNGLLFIIQKSTSGAEISRNLLKPQTKIVILAPLAPLTIKISTFNV